MLFSLVSLIQRARASLSRFLPLLHLNIPPKDPHKLGRWGEDLVVRLLKREGLRVVARNWRDGKREIDLVMVDRKRGEVVFVEVKTRTRGMAARNDIEGEPLEDEQLERISAAMRTFFERHSLMLKRWGVKRYRLELVEVGIGAAELLNRCLMSDHSEYAENPGRIVGRSTLRQGPLRMLSNG